MVNISWRCLVIVGVEEMRPSFCRNAPRFLNSTLASHAWRLPLDTSEIPYNWVGILVWASVARFGTFPGVQYPEKLRDMLDQRSGGFLFEKLHKMRPRSLPLL